MWKTSVAWNRNFNMWCDAIFSIQSRTVFVYHMAQHSVQAFWFTFHPVTQSSLPSRSLCFHFFISIIFSLFSIFCLFFFLRDSNLIKYDSMLKDGCLVNCKWSSSKYDYAHVFCLRAHYGFMLKTQTFLLKVNNSAL